MSTLSEYRAFTTESVRCKTLTLKFSGFVKSVKSDADSWYDIKDGLICVLACFACVDL